MPYILPMDREALKTAIFAVEDAKSLTKGDLNFIFTTLIHDWLDSHGVCYSNVNDMIGVLECCKLELYRQIAAPYEDVKKKENGPVSELDGKGTNE